jgi:hypothetical protein
VIEWLLVLYLTAGGNPVAVLKYRLPDPTTGRTVMATYAAPPEPAVVIVGCEPVIRMDR